MGHAALFNPVIEIWDDPQPNVWLDLTSMAHYIHTRHSFGVQKGLSGAQPCASFAPCKRLVRFSMTTGATQLRYTRSLEARCAFRWCCLSLRQIPAYKNSEPFGWGVPHADQEGGMLCDGNWQKGTWLFACVQVRHALSEHILVETGNWTNGKNFQNHFLIFSLLFCTLHSKFS